MASSGSFESRFENLIRFIDDATDKIKSDNIVNFDNLDEQVTALCKEVEKSAVQTAQDLKPVMGQMITKLDELADALADYQTRLRDQKKS